MNTAIVPFPSFGYEDFASSIVATTRRLGGRASQVLQSRADSACLFAPLASTGIAESVNQIVVDRSSTLSPALRQRIGELSDLKPSWDGEGAKMVKSYVLADVVEALKRFAQRMNGFSEPFLAPTFGGFVQIEWHDEKRSLEIEAVNQGWAIVGTMIGNDGKHHYFTTECERSDFVQLEKFYAWFSGAELIWPSL